MNALNFRTGESSVWDGKGQYHDGREEWYEFSDGTKHGKYREYYSNGQLAKESTFINGMEQGRPRSGWRMVPEVPKQNMVFYRYYLDISYHESGVKRWETFWMKPKSTP